MSVRGWNNWTAPKLYGPTYNRLQRERYAEVLEELLLTPFDEVRTIAKYGEECTLVYLVACQLVAMREGKSYRDLDKMLERVIGRVPDTPSITAAPTARARNFEEFCVRAGYPCPYLRQVEMMQFGMQTPGAKMILGARGYGKTDYVVIMGAAWTLYNDPKMTFLLMTKSEERNASIVAEIAAALRANGHDVERETSSFLRLPGLVGKDHSFSSLTLGAKSMRGRHPKKAILDDVVTEDDTSPAARRLAQTKYNELNKLTDDILLIGQPVHKFDLYETLRPLVQKIEIPHGSIPELDHDLEAQKAAGVSPESISASYHLKVVSESGFPFERINTIKRYPTNESAVAFLDPSFKGGDYSALSIGRAYFDGLAIKGRAWKRAWYDCIDDMVEELLRCNVKRLCIETNTLGDEPVIALRDALDDTGIGIVGQDSKGHKHARILAAGAYSHLLHLADDSDHIYKEHVKKYEYGSDYDDAPDSLAGLLIWLGLIRMKMKVKR